MTTMIEDAVKQLKAGIDQTRAAQRRQYALGQMVVVRFKATVDGRQKMTWRLARVTSFVLTGNRYVYQVYAVQGHDLKYMVVGTESMRKA